MQASDEPREEPALGAVQVPPAQSGLGLWLHDRLRPVFGLAHKLAEEAAKSWRRIRASSKVAELLDCTKYHEGIPVAYNPLDEQLGVA